MRRLVVFGDSIAFGQGVSLHLGWVAQLSQRIQSQFGDDILIVNSSVNGSTTHGALNRIAYEIQSPGVDVVIIQFGLNDCNYWVTDKGLPRVSKESFQSNLNEIIDRSQNFGAHKIFLLTNHPTNRKVPFDHAPVSYQDSNKDYNKIIRKVAELKSVIQLIDIETIFEIESELNTPQGHLLEDGLHLNLVGHEIYAKTIIPKVVEYLKQS